MFERFTDSARRVVVLAQEDARTFRHSHIGTEHFLLALLHEGEGIGAQTLTGLGITYERARQSLEEVVGFGVQEPSGHMPFTPRARAILTTALTEAQQLGNGEIDTQHLLLGLLAADEGIGVTMLVRLGAGREQVRARVLALITEHDEIRSRVEPPAPAQDTRETPAPAEDTRETPASATPLGRLRDLFGGDRDPDSAAPVRSSIRSRGPVDKVSRTLHYQTSIGVDLSEKARRGELDPLAGREKYAADLLGALCRRDRNNALLIGGSGVGKTALIAGVAQVIADEQTPESLLGTTVWQVDHSQLWTARMRTLMGSEAEKTVLVVEDLDHLLAADQPGPGFAASTLNAICHSPRPLIGTITPAGYATLLAAHPLLAAQFQRIDLPPAGAEETVAILTALRERYQVHHGVTITDEAIATAPALAATYLPTRHLPGAAVELIDLAGSRIQAARARHLRRVEQAGPTPAPPTPTPSLTGALLAEVARDAAA
ncbi:MAG TPA: Clp protease N-terminal domain-containing protein [Actinocrinis sp.]|nr:Clp protease N-terminal domain-containing protein [Actinocrinis sp.]